MGARPTFVGRERELNALSQAWSLGSRGARQVVFVGGEPGVGKSSIVAQIAAVVHEQDAAVLLGTCVSAMGAPYQPFIEPMLALEDAIEAGELMADRPETDRRRCLRALRLIGGRSGADQPAERRSVRELFEDCTQVILAATGSRPLLIVLEDLHWAGDTALQLLRYLVGHTAESRLTILATQRTTRPDRSADLVSTVAQLYRLDGVRRIDVDGLSTEEIADYLLAEAGVHPRLAPGAAAVLRDLTGGNPFLLTEVWRELAGHGGVAALQDVDLRAPESLLDNVSHRLAGLPPGHRRTVEYAAVIGEEFPVSLVTAVAGRAISLAPQAPVIRADVTDAAASTYAGLEAATAVGLIAPVRGMDGVFRFPHGLARQAVLDLLTNYQRALDNACVATVLEFDFPAADLRVQRLAHHYAAAQALGYAGKAVQYLGAAGEAAEAGLAHHEAARLYERAASLSPDPEERDELRLKAARGYLRASAFQRARELDEQVATTGKGLQRLRAAIGYEAASWRSGQPGEPSVALLTAALDAGELDQLHPISIRGTAALGRALAFAADLQRSAALGRRSVALARETGDELLLAVALQIGLQLSATPAELPDKLSRATELTELAERIGDLRHLGAASYHRAAICYVLGDPVGLAAAHRDLARAARVTGQPFWEWVESSVTFGIHFLRADFAEASRVATQTRELGRSFGPDHQPEGPFGLQSFMLRRETGGLERVRGLISGQEDPSMHWAPGLLALYNELDMTAPAALVLHHLIDHDLGRYQISATWPVVLSFLAEAAVRLGDVDAATTVLPMVAEYAGMNMLGAEFAAPGGSADRHLGALESLLGIRTADDRFAAAVAMDTRMGSPVHLASTLAAQVVHLRRTGQRAGLIADAAERAHDLAARHGLVRVDKQLAEAEQLDRSRHRQSAGLTPRESEVLCLLGAGFSNRRIADTLYISENTAANHVRSILMKTGAANRTQAAMYASSQGLLEQPTEPRPDTSRRSSPHGPR